MLRALAELSVSFIRVLGMFWMLSDAVGSFRPHQEDPGAEVENVVNFMDRTP